MLIDADRSYWAELQLYDNYDTDHHLTSINETIMIIFIGMVITNIEDDDIYRNRGNNDNDDDDNDNNDHQYRGCTTERNLSTVTETVDLWFLFIRILKNIDLFFKKNIVLSLHLCNTSFPPDVYQVDPVKEIWMKGKSQGKTRGWTHT